uniref:C2 domain-containing protein n=1 Tax=Salarias fasciatus TaxID=181472 RepID=A0A672FAF1_SALFA
MASCSSLLLLLLLGCLGGVQSQVRVFDLRASKLPQGLMSTTDGYVKVFLGSATLGKTSVRNNDANPWWAEDFAYFYAQANDVLRLEVHDDDILFDDLIGVCQRQLQVGTHEHDCFLEKGGTLHYSYDLKQ